MNRIPLRLVPVARQARFDAERRFLAGPRAVDQFGEVVVGGEPVVHEARHVRQVDGRVRAVADGQGVLERKLRAALHHFRLDPGAHPELPGLADDDPHRLIGGALSLERLVQRGDVLRRLRRPRLPRQRLEALQLALLVDDPEAVAGEERRVVRQPVAERVEL
jgi:hypothetical protein